MSTHDRCKHNCGSTDCTARKRIEAARQAQPMAELERKMHKAHRRGLWTQEAIDWCVGAGRELASKLRRKEAQP